MGSINDVLLNICQVATELQKLALDGADFVAIDDAISKLCGLGDDLTQHAEHNNDRSIAFDLECELTNPEGGDE